jgi:hypothetical protein
MIFAVLVVFCSKFMADRGAGFSAGWEILVGRQDARRPHSQDGYAPKDSDAG